MSSGVTLQYTVAASTAAVALAGAPEQANATVTPSLKNFFLSLGAGGTLLLLIFGAVIGVSQVDKVCTYDCCTICSPAND